MIYKEPFVFYLNISVCIILLFLAIPSLLNRKEDLKIRLAFSLIFFIVISTCLVNLVTFYAANHSLAFLGWTNFLFALSFGPTIYYYVKSLLGSKISSGIIFSQIPGVAATSYGIYMALVSEAEQEKIFNQMQSGEHLFYEIINLLTLILTLVYCFKAWLFIKNLQLKNKENQHSPFNIKVQWAREFIIYMFVNVFVFLLLVLVLTRGFGVTTMAMDLIGMPVFMLIVYLLIAIRSMMMYKEFEHQLILTGIEHDKQIQDQRLEIARDLHDSLGAQLTFITSITDSLIRKSDDFDEHLKMKAKSLSDLTANATAELKNALWVLNSGQITLEDLKIKLLNLVKSAGDAMENVQYHFQFDLSENVPVNSKWAVNLFRVVQEILNNAAKYAQSKDVWIKINQAEGVFKLEIQDNGIGFDVKQVKNKSFGFSNLQQRVKAMNGSLQVDSGRGKGTSYFIEIPLR